MIQKTYDGLSSRFHIDSLGFFKESVRSEGDDGVVQVDSD